MNHKQYRIQIPDKFAPMLINCFGETISGTLKEWAIDQVWLAYRIRVSKPMRLISMDSDIADARSNTEYYITIEEVIEPKR